MCGAGIEEVTLVLQMLIPGSEVAPKAGFCSDQCLAKKLGFVKPSRVELDPNGAASSFDSPGLAGIE